MLRVRSETYITRPPIPPPITEPTIHGKTLCPQGPVPRFPGFWQGEHKANAGTIPGLARVIPGDPLRGSTGSQAYSVVLPGTNLWSRINLCRLGRGSDEELEHREQFELKEVSASSLEQRGSLHASARPTRSQRKEPIHQTEDTWDWKAMPRQQESLP